MPNLEQSLRGLDTPGGVPTETMKKVTAALADFLKRIAHMCHKRGAYVESPPSGVHYVYDALSSVRLPGLEPELKGILRPTANLNNITIPFGEYAISAFHTPARALAHELSCVSFFSHVNSGYWNRAVGLEHRASHFKVELSVTMQNAQVCSDILASIHKVIDRSAQFDPEFYGPDCEALTKARFFMGQIISDLHMLSDLDILACNSRGSRVHPNATYDDPKSVLSVP